MSKLDREGQEARKSELYNIIFHQEPFDPSLLSPTLQSTLASYFTGEAKAYQYYSPKDTKYHVFQSALSLYSPNFTTPLRSICEAYIMFFIHKLVPYRPIEEYNICQRWVLLNSVKTFEEGSEFQTRWSRGLIRPGLIRFIDAWMRASLSSLSRLLEAGVDEVELVEACRRSWLPALAGGEVKVREGRDIVG